MVQISYWKHLVLRALLCLQVRGQGAVMKSEDFVEEMRVCRGRMDFITALLCVPGLDGNGELWGSCSSPAGWVVTHYPHQEVVFPLFLGQERCVRSAEPWEVVVTLNCGNSIAFSHAHQILTENKLAVRSR